MIDKRKNIRFKVDTNSFIILNEKKLTVIDMCLNGLKTENVKNANKNETVDVTFYFENQRIGVLKIKKVNEQGSNSGWEICQQPDEYSELFNPVHLIKKIKIKKSQDFIEYSDSNSSLFFRFFYSEDKKIIKTLIFFRQVGLEFSNDYLKTYKDLDLEDPIANEKTIEMFKTIVENSSCFVSSFKEWLLDSIITAKK